MDQAPRASPKFVPRLNFATADSALAGISLSWGDCADLGDHLLIVLKLERLRVALVLVDARWRIVAVQQFPIVLQKCHPDDKVGPIDDVAIRILRNSPDSFEGLLSIEQRWYRIYPNPTYPGGTELTSWNVSWYRVKCRFFAGIPILTCELERTETERHNVQFCTGGDSGYWLSSTFALPSPRPEPCGPLRGYVLEIAEPDSTGLPMEWRQVRGIASSGERESTDQIYSTADVNSFDRDHAACLIEFNEKLFLAALDLAKAEVKTPVKISTARGL